MQAYLNKQTVKNKYLKRVKAHYKADEIIHGAYWQNGKGCAVGCTIHSSDHARYEKELGIPESIALLEDELFEGLSNGEAKEFPLRFLDAIKPGADLTKVEYKFKLWLLTDKHNGIQQWANDETKKIIKQIAKLQKEASEGRMPKPEKWQKAESAARSAARSAWSARSAARSAWSAGSAAWSAAGSAGSAARSAGSAAWSAGWSAESAARSAGSAGSAAWSAARSAQYKAMAEKLLQLLEEAE